ncbi:hypothetical protein BN1723_019469, partial [Verticillium longisporum]
PTGPPQGEQGPQPATVQQVGDGHRRPHGRA